MILKRKRGQIELKVIIELIIGLLICFSFFYIAKSFGTEDIYDKIRLSSDSAASVNSLYGTSENGFLLFPVDSKYIVSLQNNLIKVLDSAQDPTESIRYFIKGRDFIQAEDLSKPISFIISKSGDIISLEQDSPKSFVQRCPSVTLTKPINLIISPKTQESQLYSFTEQLSAFIQGSETKDIQDIPNNAEIVIEIKETNSNKLTAYFKPNIESRKLACLLSNSLLSQNTKLELSLIPSEEDSFKKAKVAILIEVPRNIDKQSAVNTIARAYNSIT